MAQDIQKYWSIRHVLAIMDGVAVKGKQIIITSKVQADTEPATYQPHGNSEKKGCFHADLYTG